MHFLCKKYSTQGNTDWDLDLEILLPNGHVCRPSSHGLPPANVQTLWHGMTELEGVLYKLGGIDPGNNRIGQESPWTRKTFKNLISTIGALVLLYRSINKIKREFCRYFK